MDRGPVLEAIGRFREGLEKRGIRVSRIVLYGSWAGGQPHEGSDIDLVVISQDFADRDFWQRVEVLSEAIYEVFEPIEAVGMTPEEWDEGHSPIIDFAKTGEPVYSA